MVKILYLVTEAPYFFSHRYSLAKEAVTQGYKVFVATSPMNYEEKFEKEGFILIPLDHFNRSSMNVFKEIKAIIEIFKIYKKLKPHIVHHIALKPILYGTLVGRLTKIPKIINTLTGLGYLFISKKLINKGLCWIILKIMTFLMKSQNVILSLQNTDDYNKFLKILPKLNLSLIRGSGVNLKEFFALKNKAINLIPTVTIVARMLWDKGIGDAVDANRILKSRGIKINLILAGSLDYVNPQGIHEEKIKEWESHHLCIWRNKVNDVAGLYQHTDIALLPSYREGLPKSLLEAAACKLPIITTNVPGCREIGIHNETALLVPVKNSDAIADAIERLLKDKTLAKNLGLNAYKWVKKNGSDSHIINQTFELYSLKA